MKNLNSMNKNQTPKCVVISPFHIEYEIILIKQTDVYNGIHRLRGDEADLVKGGVDVRHLNNLHLGSSVSSIFHHYTSLWGAD